MHQTFERNWWLFVVRGLAAITFGVLAIVWPAPTIAVLVALFAAYAFVDGVSLLWHLVRGDSDARRNGWTFGLMGVVGIVAAAIAVTAPGLTAVALLYVVAFWLIAVGVFQVIAAWRLRWEIHGEGWMALGGVLAITFGALLAAYPGVGLLSLLWVIGAWAIMFGVSNLVLASRVRNRGHDVALGTA
jgi:uncharacterized membrane protein HdeD (DUF308 family)